MSRRVLVVDDSTSMRQMVGYTLTQAGFQVQEGANGKEGLDRLDGGAVELIITDLNMPVMDGLTFIKAVRSRPEFKFTPILMLTTEAGDERKKDGKAAGATGWIVKPFDPEKLLQVVAKVLP